MPRHFTPPPVHYCHPDWVMIYRAYDHGFHPDPAVCLWIAVVGKRWIVFKEMQWTRTIVSDIAKDILEASKDMRVITTYADPTIGIQSGADINTIKDRLEACGIPIELSVNNREQFANAIHEALGTEIEPGVPRIQFLKSGCPKLIKYLPLMTYQQNAPSKLADHKHDHLPVALAYFLMSHIPTSSPKATSTVPWYWRAGYKPQETGRKVLGSGNVRQK